VIVTDDIEDASRLTGIADTIRSTKLISKRPPSLSTDNEVTESTTLSMYLPPTATAVGIGQEKRDDDAAGDALLVTTEGLDDKINRQM
jgi:hypothetical protein